MPELPEVEIVRQSLKPTLEGSAITDITLRRKDLRIPIPSDLTRQLMDQRIRSIRRRSKYLLIDLDNSYSVIIHLGMSGKLYVTTANDYKPQKHDHMILKTDNNYNCVFNDPRRFGLITIAQTKQLPNHPLLQHLGPEPLTQAFDGEYLAQRLVTKKAPIKNVIMDSRIVVGVGNIYASESLFLAGVNPQIPACQLSVQQIHDLVESIKVTLNKALEAGGSTLKDFVDGNGKGGYFQHQFQVYNRKDQPCFTCATPIRHLKQAGRSSYYCPQCQPSANV